MPPARLHTDNDQDWAAFEYLQANSGATNAQIAGATGRTKAAIDQAAARGRWRARLAAAVEAPEVARVDPAERVKEIATHTLALFHAKTKDADPDDVSFAEIGTALRGLERVLAQPAQTTEVEDPSIPFRVDLDRYALSDLPPLRCHSLNFSRLTFRQAESLCWLVARAGGSDQPWRQSNEVSPSSPEENDPPYEQINGERS